MTNEKNFRDSLATVDTQGRRIWVYPHRPSGRLYTARSLVAMLLLGFLFAAPFIRVGGNQLMLFDILNRHFLIFGVPFWPQDFHLLAIGAIAFLVFVVLFTAAFGRLFCGWVCPQTVFMEMLFRRIEFFIEGNGPRQRRLDQADWTANKLIRKGIKHFLFLAISFLIGNTLLAYFIGSEKLIKLVTFPPSEHATGFVLLLLFSLAFYGIYARFREQVCTLVCPYGRLQSVLLDNNSIVVAYDQKRGEPRGPAMRHGETSTFGDCLDCAACVRVCPTGIDIRNGTQLECINCTACIDACNKVMAKAGRSPKLIRYASQNQVATGSGFRLTGRLAAYGVILIMMVGLLTLLTFGRSKIETTILRTTGSLYEELEGGKIRNLYTIKVLNRTSGEISLELNLKRSDGVIKVVGPPLTVKVYGSAESVLAVEIPKESLYSASSPIVIEVTSGDEILDKVMTTFNGPQPL